MATLSENGNKQLLTRQSLKNGEDKDFSVTFIIKQLLYHHESHTVLVLGTNTLYCMDATLESKPCFYDAITIDGVAFIESLGNLLGQDRSLILAHSGEGKRHVLKFEDEKWGICSYKYAGSAI